MKRYDISIVRSDWDTVRLEEEECHAGEWVRYEDANAEMERMKALVEKYAEMDTESIRQCKAYRKALEKIAAPGDDRWFVSVAREALGGGK